MERSKKRVSERGAEDQDGRVKEPYHRRYYREHRADLRLRRRAWYQKNRERISKQRKEKYQEIPRVAIDQKQIKTIDGQRYFSIGAVSSFVGYDITTLRKWERSGVIPRAIFFSVRGWRLYSKSQVDMMVYLMRQLRSKNISKAGMTEILEARWKDGTT